MVSSGDVSMSIIIPYHGPRPLPPSTVYSTASILQGTRVCSDSLPWLQDIAACVMLLGTHGRIRPISIPSSSHSPRPPPSFYDQLPHEVLILIVKVWSWWKALFTAWPHGRRAEDICLGHCLLDNLVIWWKTGMLKCFTNPCASLPPGPAP